MFHCLYTTQATAEGLFLRHPRDISATLEAYFRSAYAAEPGVSLLTKVKAPARHQAERVHLIYAYMIENTAIYEIFQRVVNEFVHGEKLGIPVTSAAQAWLRNTEELFFNDPPPFSIGASASLIRPDMRAIRRNAYQRMFGMELNHGRNGGHAYPYARADAANNKFATTFEELLREVWIGLTNTNNTSGQNPTDNDRIEELARQLQDMLNARRLNGNLRREEFFSVVMMSWLHLTVSYDVPIINDLRANATSPEQRLFKVAERVGFPAHGLSRSYFGIAEAMSRILIFIESRNTPASPLVATDLYASSAAGTNVSDMRTIITHWSIITGRDIKAGKVAA
ncbi:MAG: hypothetical protein M5U12_23025 [Verrucomicrobia bacterium]|nr:hypothetical protein [Verrucomicrobiota bacterium]